MNAETARSFEDLEEQANLIMGIFREASCEQIAPAIIQPADAYLDVIGERLRGRTYVFTDPDGEELCLRPDLTVPVARLYLERNPAAESRARYCYNGSAFRFQPDGDDLINPREFRQAGLEIIGAQERERTEAEVTGLVCRAVEAAGLTDYKIRMGDLGLFHALLEKLDITQRWRNQISENFWRKDEFHALLSRLAHPMKAEDLSLSDDLLSRLDPEKPKQAEVEIGDYLREKNIPVIGTRTLGEITAQLLERAADVGTQPLSKEVIDIIESYTKITAPPRAAGARISDLLSEAGIDLSVALDTFQTRLDALGEFDVDLGNATFSAEFGRDFEYYTGYVFQLESDNLPANARIAGGGRYDNLLRAIGSEHGTNAVGSAIHTERLLSAVKEIAR